MVCRCHTTVQFGEKKRQKGQICRESLKKFISKSSTYHCSCNSFRSHSGAAAADNPSSVDLAVLCPFVPQFGLQVGHKKTSSSYCCYWPLCNYFWGRLSDHKHCLGLDVRYTLLYGHPLRRYSINTRY